MYAIGVTIMGTIASWVGFLMTYTITRDLPKNTTKRHVVGVLLGLALPTLAIVFAFIAGGR